MAIDESSLIRCPVCFSILIEPYENLSIVATYLKEQEAIPQSVEISEDNDELVDIVIESLENLNKTSWKGDPILTKRGYAGEDYKGLQKLKKIHLQKIQEKRQQQEIDVGIPEEERTQFTEINANGYSRWDKKHILELRQSTEKILIQSGQIKIENEIELADLEIYFNYDENGEYRGTYKYGNKIDDKIDWTDVDRTIEGYENQPKFPENLEKVKNIHIEDLRHSTLIGWYDDFTGLLLEEEEKTKSLSSSVILSGDGSVEQLQTDSDSFSENLVDNKSDELVNYMQVYSRCRLFKKNIGFPLGAQNASATGSSSIIREKPIKVILSSSALVSSNIISLKGNSYAENRHQQKLTWEADKFKNPSPNPNILITDNTRLLLDITGSWSTSEWNTHGVGSFTGNFTTRNVIIDIQIWTVDNRNVTIRLEPSLIIDGVTHERLVGGEWTGSYWRQKLISGINLIKLKEAFDNKYLEDVDVSKYFCKRIIVLFYVDSKAQLDSTPDFPSESVSVSMDVTFNKIGLTF